MIHWATACIALLALPLLMGGARLDQQTERLARFQSAHIMLLAPAGRDMGGLLDELERAYRDVQTFGLRLPSRVEARSYGTTSAFVRGSGGFRYNLALARDEVVHLQPVPVLLSRGELPRVLKHELTHVALFDAARRGLPRWLNEGVAMAAAGEKLPETITFKRLRDLEDTLARSKTYRTVRSAYGTSGRLAGRLIALFGRERVLGMLRSVAGGNSFERAFTALAGTSPEEWGKRELSR